MTDAIFYWFLALNLVAGFWFVYGIVVTEIRGRRDRRADKRSPATPRIDIPESASRPDSVTVRGYDSPNLFREDALERIKELEKEIERDLKEIGRRSDR